MNNRQTSLSLINSQAVDHLSEAQQQVEQLMKNNNMVNEDIKGIEIDLNF